MNEMVSVPISRVLVCGALILLKVRMLLLQSAIAKDVGAQDYETMETGGSVKRPSSESSCAQYETNRGASLAEAVSMQVGEHYFVG